MIDLTFNWWNEFVENVPTKKWLYKIITFLLAGRKLTYRELYIILLEINGGNKVDEKSKLVKKKCFERILEIYKFNKNKLPEEIEYYVGE